MTNLMKEFDKFFVGYDDMMRRAQDRVIGTPNYPPYNIKKMQDNKYVIEMAVAGFSKDDIDISVKGDKLTIAGEIKPDLQSTDVFEHDYTPIYNGLALRPFTRVFTLSSDTLVEDAEMKDGLLKITLKARSEDTLSEKIEIK
jgi:molecular chaperone IbpA